MVHAYSLRLKCVGTSQPGEESPRTSGIASLPFFGPSHWRRPVANSAAEALGSKIIPHIEVSEIRILDETWESGIGQ
jgi:hypothetical protein